MMTDKLRTSALQRASDLVYPHRRRASLPAISPIGAELAATTLTLPR
jgi:hypothetical protein